MDDQIQRMKVLGAGIFSLILAMGVARFAYTPLLPVMQAQAGLGLAEGGWLAAINYAGYLTGALVAASISDLVLKDRLFRVAMVMAVLTTAMMGLSDSLAVWALSRYLAGLATSGAMLLGTGLILNWLIRHGHRSELGIHFAGVGIGIAACSVAVAWMSSMLDWRGQWFVFTAIACVLLIPALGWLPAPDTSPVTKSGAPMHDDPPSPLFLKLFMVSYFCAGIGYVVSATFIVAIVNGLPGLEGKGSWTFFAIGMAAAPACIVWDFIARRSGELNALILAAVLQIVGILLPVVVGGVTGAAAGALLFGGTFVGMVSLVLTMAGRYYPTRPAKMMGKMTISYGVAQIIGPAVTGWLGEAFGSYAGGLYFAAVMMALGTALLMMLKAVERRDLAVRASCVRA
ncbi:YbfB/YjiJ family MFS transporter [Thauera linaloolentis]|uniref:Major facilitator superfamily protein n=1 Tax=Thauera linaloolentis (strain DSM 12138 / JCM 21573 / CCUG 41526 / CIP 105981 / IAM 15112 / NBRC 102519 / 47Lol) TaxID=1123367 RepID=N6ZAE3_THAL4|nr:YbfB/YjiJ family MFS transporter [Thauera linaloolentis]ENO89164.1 major facilitator superfamily protein [Thauera linaloolentis 47Lol = DSM 12138]MCM8567304.1 YbfB/YjiJ family MFS transporter [Thauera linaloolentis]